jgi:hypothetical protein
VRSILEIGAARDTHVHDEQPDRAGFRQQFLTVGDQLRAPQGHDWPGALDEVILQILEQEC